VKGLSLLLSPFLQAGRNLSAAIDWKWLKPNLPLIIGVAVIAFPTIMSISDVAWSTEQGAHGPIVLAIAIWLLFRGWPQIRAVSQPGSLALGVPALIVFLASYIVTRIIGSVVLESASLYAALVTTLYLFVGARAIRAAWFPICYFLFVLPPPGSVIAAATQPLRLQISNLAVVVLSWFGMPVAREGLMIYVAQYALEVKVACGGLNSMISLTAISLFYGYVSHKLNAAYGAVIFVVSILLAIMANFVRVLIVILMTYFLGDAAAQGFSHGLAGMTMFTFAVIGIITFDWAAAPLRRRLGCLT